jgi:hypothetical protein
MIQSIKKRNSKIKRTKQAKIHSSHSYNSAKVEGQWNFNGQSSKRCIIRHKRWENNLYVMISGFGENRNSYSVQHVYPGQKVWVIRMHVYTGQYSVDYDYVREVFSSGPLGSGYLVDYWLYNYGIGHGLEYNIDFFSSKLIAKHFLNKVRVANLGRR